MGSGEEGVDDKSGAGFSLAPFAVAAMDDERVTLDAIANMTTVAASFEKGPW